MSEADFARGMYAHSHRRARSVSLGPKFTNEKPEVHYRAVRDAPAKNQRKLDVAFDLLFEAVLRMRSRVSDVNNGIEVTDSTPTGSQE
jgi:hypothetical protein